MKKQHIVRLVANRNKYTKFPFMAVAKFNSMYNTYETGQHIIPGVIKDEDGLSSAEMTGEKPLSEAKALKFPFVINPDDQIPIVHLTTLNLSTDADGNIINYKDAALYNFFVNHSGVVAKTKDDIIADTHFFYIEDKEVEASKRITDRKLKFKAQAKVQADTSIRRLKDVALMLSYNIKGLGINVNNVSLLQLEDNIMDACEKHPEAVLACYEEGAEDTLFILKLINNKILQKGQTGGYYDGQIFLGQSIEEVLSFSKKTSNEGLLDKWIKLQARFDGVSKEGNAFMQEDVLRGPSNQTMEMYYKSIAAVGSYVLSKDIKNAEYHLSQAKIYNANGSEISVWEEKLNELIRLTNEFNEANRAAVSNKDDYALSLEEKNFEALKAICRQRKFKSEEWNTITEENIAELRAYIVSKVKAKSEVQPIV